jgi:hypothetical protein
VINKLTENKTRIGTRPKKSQSFLQAKKFVRGLGLKTHRKRGVYRRNDAGKLKKRQRAFRIKHLWGPRELSYLLEKVQQLELPSKTYKNDWKDLDDWLGTTLDKMKFRPFEEARIRCDNWLGPEAGASETVVVR